MRIIVGISGASGVILGYHLLKALKTLPDCEIHLVITNGAKLTFEYETELDIREVEELADYVYDENNLGVLISSGSYLTDGMIVIPCSMKTLSGIVNGYSDNLLLRAVDVCLKENRRVVLVPREMPFGKIHVDNIKRASDLGCIIMPPVLTFYNNPKTIADHINHIIGKILYQYGITYKEFKAWDGKKK